MKWSEYLPIWKKVANSLGKPHNIGWEQAIEHMLNKLSDDDMGGIWTKERIRSLKFGMSAERAWMRDCRPYYDLYPSVIEPFFRVDLSKVLGRHLSLPPQVLVRIPFGYEISRGSLKVGAFLIISERVETGLKIGICATMFHESLVFSMIVLNENSVESELLDFTGSDVDKVDIDDFKYVSNRIMKIACALSLIRDNPDIIEPLPLENDSGKFEKATDFERKALLERAKRRGKVGWAVGKRVETVAGVRCPHFAIRWMGHGEPKTPVLRPISGCIVNRRKLSEVPTGYLDDIQE